MHHPQFTLKMMLWLVALVAAFFGTLGRVDGPFALFLLIVWGAVLAGCIGAMWSRAHALLAAFFAFFLLSPIWGVVAGLIGLTD